MMHVNRDNFDGSKTSVDIGVCLWTYLSLCMQASSLLGSVFKQVSIELRMLKPLFSVWNKWDFIMHTADLTVFTLRCVRHVKWKKSRIKVYRHPQAFVFEWGIEKLYSERRLFFVQTRFRQPRILWGKHMELFQGFHLLLQYRIASNFGFMSLYSIKSTLRYIFQILKERKFTKSRLFDRIFMTCRIIFWITRSSDFGVVQRRVRKQKNLS